MTRPIPAFRLHRAVPGYYAETPRAEETESTAFCYVIGGLALVPWVALLLTVIL